MRRIIRTAILAVTLGLTAATITEAPARAETWACEAVAQPPQSAGPRCSSWTFSTQDYGVMAITAASEKAGAVLSAAPYQEGNSTYVVQDFTWELDDGTIMLLADPSGVQNGLCAETDSVTAGTGLTLQPCDPVNAEQRWTLSAYGACSGFDGSLGIIMTSDANSALALSFTGGSGVELKTETGASRQCVKQLD